MPSGAVCATRVRSMTENRPDNVTFNARRGTAANGRSPRVTGDFTGTTDEIIQWAACKWGLDEDWARAQTSVESGWNQRIMGDFTTNSSACIPAFPIGNYPPQWNGDATHNGQCPESIGLIQDRYAYHTEAFQGNNAVASTAYNVDYGYAVWRSCFEGEMGWLNTLEHSGTYAAGDQLGCMGVWFSGRWKTAAANDYMSKVQTNFNTKVWLASNWPPAVPDGG